MSRVCYLARGKEHEINKNRKMMKLLLSDSYFFLFYFIFQFILNLFTLKAYQSFLLFYFSLFFIVCCGGKEFTLTCEDDDIFSLTVLLLMLI